MTQAPPVTAEQTGEMTHRQVLEALSGLLLAMFVAMLSSTIVSNALPTIVDDLNGSQTGYTWVVVATMLAMTATTPIWGKFADLFDKKLLVQTALVIFSVGSLIAGFAPSMEVLIGARVVQGLGVGGLTALVQVVIATMVSPRERGRYSGYIGAVFALATVSGPLVGGVLVDTVGWRWCFFAGLPVAALAFVVLQKTLRLPVVKRDDVSIDYLGAFLLVGGVSILLVWVSLGGQNFEWLSWTSALLVVGAVAVIGAAIHVEANVAKDPVIPLRLFKDRTLTLATVASVLIGVAMFGSTVYLSLYFQRAKDMSPTEAGLMSICMVGGLLVSSILSGRIISATGVWKRWLVGGMVAVIAGIGLLATIDASTPLWRTGLFMAVLGLGLGATMQNLVLAVQNTIALSDMGAGSVGDRVLPLPRWLHRHRRTGRRAGPPGRRRGAVRPDEAAHGPPGVRLGRLPRHRQHPGRVHPAGAGPGDLRERLRRRDRSHLPGGPAVRGGRADRRPLHQGGAPAHVGEARGRARGGGRAGMISSVTTTRYDDLRRIEAEVGTLIRRVKRVMGERAREVHPDLHPMTYFILTHLAQHGPLRAADLSDAFGMDKGGVSRQVQTLVDLGLVERRPAAEDRRAILLDASDEGRRRLEAMTLNRSNRFDERLSAWSDEELAGFGDQLSAYNRALSDD